MSSSRDQLQFTIRSRTGSQSFWFPPATKVENQVETAKTILYSKDGTLLAVASSENIVIYSTDTGAITNTLPRPQVSAVDFSPQNKFLVSWERLDQAINNEEHNLIVWKLENAEPIAKFTVKNLSDAWPIIKWTNDEVYFARTTKNEVRFHAAKSPNPAESCRVLQLANVVGLEFSPSTSVPYSFATYVPEKKNNPASARIYKVYGPSAPVDIKMTCTKSFFKSTSAELMWNSTGSHLLVSTATEVDSSGKSYYGETGLYFLSADASFDCNVGLQKAGPIHDVAWSPNGKQFIATYGFMPAQSTLFDAKCNPIVDFGALPRNTIRWAPNGKYVCIGGFGNLQGQMDFWDCESLKQLGTAQAHCAAVHEWAPDSRHFL